MSAHGYPPSVRDEDIRDRSELDLDSSASRIIAWAAGLGLEVHTGEELKSRAGSSLGSVDPNGVFGLVGGPALMEYNELYFFLKGYSLAKNIHKGGEN